MDYRLEAIVMLIFLIHSHNYSTNVSSPITSAISLAILLIVSSDKETFFVNCFRDISFFLLQIQKYTKPLATDCGRLRFSLEDLFLI